MRFRTTGINLAHIGFVLVIAGVIVTTSFDISSSVVYGVDELGNASGVDGKAVTKKDIGNGWSMELAEFDVFRNPDGAWTQTAHLNAYKDGKTYCAGATGFTRTTHFGDVHNPMINRGITRDVYAQFSGTRSHIDRSGNPDKRQNHTWGIPALGGMHSYADRYTLYHHIDIPAGDKEERTAYTSHTR